MMKIYSNVCNKYRNFKNIKISYILKIILGLSTICSNCGQEYKKIFKEEESIEILKIIGLFTNIEEYQKTYENISQKFRLKNINETRE